MKITITKADGTVHSEHVFAGEAAGNIAAYVECAEDTEAYELCCDDDGVPEAQRNAVYAMTAALTEVSREEEAGFIQKSKAAAAKIVASEPLPEDLRDILECYSKPS